MRFYSRFYSNTPTEIFTINPPNHVICVLHFEIITRLLQRCRTPTRLQQFVDSKNRLTTVGPEIRLVTPIQHQTYYNFIDAHFHLDKLIARVRSSTTNLDFDDIEKMITPFHEHHLLFGIANYVFPYNWHLWKEQTNLNDRIKTTFGIHPHLATFGIPNYQWRSLNEYLHSPQRVAIGETGIDYTSNCECIKQGRICQSPDICKEIRQANQEDSFITLLQLAAQFNLPVVLHCRDSGDGSAAARTLQLIQQHNFTFLAFHRHCFIGSIAELDTWNSTLPYVVFGISIGLDTGSEMILENLIAKIPDKNLVLETDSPYLTPGNTKQINHTWNIIKTAELVAKTRNVIGYS